MANALFDKARQRFLEGQFNWNTDTIKAVLVDTGTYTVNLSAHEFLSDIGTGARISTSGAFTGKGISVHTKKLFSLMNSICSASASKPLGGRCSLPSFWMVP